MSYIRFPAPGVQTYSTLAAFPAITSDGSLALALNTYILYVFETGTGWVVLSTPGSDGDVFGPASATDTALAVFDGVTGKLLKNSVALLSNGDLSGLTSISSDAFISSTADPASTGALRLANTDGIFLRNVANDGDHSITLGITDEFNFTTSLISSGIQMLCGGADYTTYIYADGGSYVGGAFDDGMNPIGWWLAMEGTAEVAVLIGPLGSEVPAARFMGEITGDSPAGSTLIQGGLGVGNSAAGDTLGTVIKKIEVFDQNGDSLGFIPVYNEITQTP